MTLSLEFLPITPADALVIGQWVYPPPYNIYNAESDGQELLDPALNYHVCRTAGRVWWFVCWGDDARVPGFDYAEHDKPSSWLDIGGGLAPHLTGAGRGQSLLEASLRFIQAQTKAERFRVTVAEFNQRSWRACLKVGFEKVAMFPHPKTGQNFVVLTKTL
jgi:RimJ/RimL family protein N-acetyltransferase